MRSHVQIRLLDEPDAQTISAAFKEIGWGKPVSQYQRYLDEQAAGTRVCFVATANSDFAGYVTVNFRPSYPVFVGESIPEIQDLNVLPHFRRQGIGTRLLDRAEGKAAKSSDIVGIAVGLHPGYNAAQRLYVRRGYIPDGRGITYRNHYLKEGAHVVLDDELLLHFVKKVTTRG